MRRIFVFCFVDCVRGDLGDILRDVPNIARKCGLGIEDIAISNLAKTHARFGEETGVELGNRE